MWCHRKEISLVMRCPTGKVASVPVCTFCALTCLTSKDQMTHNTCTNSGLPYQFPLRGASHTMALFHVSCRSPDVTSTIQAILVICSFKHQTPTDLFPLEAQLSVIQLGHSCRSVICHFEGLVTKAFVFGCVMAARDGMKESRVWGCTLANV